jgi:hypothetical protein
MSGDIKPIKKSKKKPSSTTAGPKLKVLSVNQLLQKKYTVMKFTGVWHASFGNPEQSGNWIVWGKSANGKTSFILQLMKYLSNFGKVDFISLEEEAALTMQDGFRRFRMHECTNKVHLVLGRNLEAIKERLRKRKAARIVFIDSLQYLKIKYSEYQELKEEFPNVLFIWISQAKGRDPKGTVADDVRFDCSIKIYVEGFKAFPDGRINGGREEFVIWEKGANDYYMNNMIKKNGRA